MEYTCAPVAGNGGRAMNPSDPIGAPLRVGGPCSSRGRQYCYFAADFTGSTAIAIASV
jgi:hypothetical protein